MLDRKRFGSGGIKELTYLYQGNKPTSNNENIKIETILTYCSKKLDFNIKPMTLWYGIIKMLNNDILQSTQLEFCKKDICDDFNINTDIDINIDIKELIKNNKYESLMVIDKCSQSNIIYQFIDYITMEETDETGYIIMPHKYTHNNTKSNSVCEPNFIISQTTYDFLNVQTDLKCPICYKSITIQNIKKFSTLKKNNDSINNEFIKNIQLDNIYKVQNIENNTLHKLFSNEKNNDIQIIKFNNDNVFNQEKYIYTFNNNDFILYKNILSNVRPKILNFNDFSDVVTNLYPFIKKLQFKNYYIVGGFCRSILLDNKVKDIDIFVTKNADINEIKNEIIQEFNKEKKFKLIMQYKKKFGVHELIFIKDNNTKIEMIIQIIDKEYNCISDIFKSFDLMSCKIGFDNKNLYFSEESLFAYNNMINIISQEKIEKFNSTNLNRIDKYLNFGFSILIKKNELDIINKYIDLNNNHKNNFINILTELKILKSDNDNNLENKYNLYENIETNDLYKYLKLSYKKIEKIKKHFLDNDIYIVKD